MSFYHFTIDNRESILIYRMQGLNAKLLHRHPSSISREWKRYLREYFPKGSDITLVDEQTIQLWENKLNNRSRKYLKWKTPYEVFYEENVYLI